MIVHSYLLKKDEKEASLSLIRDHIDEKRQELAAIASMSSSLQEKLDEFQSNLQLQDIRTSHAVSLYSKISHLSWDYDKCSSRVLSGCKCRRYDHIKTR